jgi:thiamine monophosphate synthase
MPILSGTKMIKILRELNYKKLIIGISSSEDDDLKEFYSCSIDYVFSKPLDENKLNLIFNLLNSNPR